MVGDFHAPVSEETLQAEIRKAVGELGATVNLTYQISTDGTLQSKTRRLSWNVVLSCTISGDGEGNGNPLQCSCLENPMDRGAWRATDHGVTKESDTTE